MSKPSVFAWHGTANVVFKHLQMNRRFFLTYQSLIVVFCFLLSFFFIRIYNAKTVFMVPTSGDDAGYLAYSEAWFGNQSMDWCREGVTSETLKDMCEASAKKVGVASAYNKYTPGPAVLLLPFNLIGTLLASSKIFVPGMPVLVFWTIVGSFFLFMMGVLFLFRAAFVLLADEAIAFWTTLFFMTGNVVTYYVFRRPLMAHVSEFFLLTLCFDLYLRSRQSFNWGVYLALGFFFRNVGHYSPLRYLLDFSFFSAFDIFCPHQVWGAARV